MHERSAYCCSQCCEYYRRWKKQQKRSIRQLHRAGEKLLIDYSGATMAVINRTTGEIRRAEIFVAVLGASNYTFAEATGVKHCQTRSGPTSECLRFLVA